MNKKLKFYLYCVLTANVIGMLFIILVNFVGTLPYTIINTYLFTIPFDIVIGFFMAAILSFGCIEDDGGPSGSANG